MLLKLCRCPFEAIAIINLPTNLESQVTHRYTANSFKLHRLPTPRPGQVLGLVGTNGIGKSTALKILAGKLKPNLGRYDDPPDWQEILKYFRGSELQNYFTKVLEDNLKALIKPQYVDHIPKAIKGNLTVSQMLDSKLERDNKQAMCDDLELNHVLDREVGHLSGGELQRFAIAMSCIQNADVYMFDEPSSYLDVKQRLKAAEVIRDLITPSNYIIAVEHDLSTLDYLSDFICCLYGKPSMYGVVTMPYSVREGINIFLDGFIPTENLRFREESLSFKMVENAEELIVDQTLHYSYPAMTKTLGGFKLTVEAGSFTDSEIVVMLGENGTGKTTFIRLLAGDTPDDETDKQSLLVSLKPQTISPKFAGTVRMLLIKMIKTAFMHPQFQTDVLKPMNLENIMDQEVKTLSGGELQRVAIVLALGKPNVQIYLLDEPSS
jgi:ATP-binding cassette subfamily E protein 1